MAFISQMLQMTEMNKVVYDVSQDTFKDHLETATVGEQEGHGWELVRKSWEKGVLLRKLEEVDKWGLTVSWKASL